jgi:BirA family biotin operon repressor/biotin-[acetyl-CoA-carboxylase] ligase
VTHAAAAAGVPEAWEGRPVEAWREAWRLPRLIVLQRTTSTNDVARAAAEAGTPHGTLVLADEQTAGRGRPGRIWHAAPARSILASFVLRIPRGATAPAAAPIRIGLAAAYAIGVAAGVAARVKWPNDLLAPDGLKLAGVLCEGSLGETGGLVIAGIGINVLQTADELPPGAGATSLALAGARDPSRAAVAGALAAAVMAAAPHLAEPLGPHEIEAWQRRDALRDLDITIDGVHAGRVLGISDQGALLVRTPFGIRPFWTGTVRTVAGAARAARSAPDDDRSTGGTTTQEARP